MTVECPHCGTGHSKSKRNWAVWRARHTTDNTLRVIGETYAIGDERVRQIVLKRDKAVHKAITSSRGTPVPDEVREGILGVEFVFTHESLAEGRGWSSLATSTEWRRECGYIDTYAHTLDEGIVYRVKKVSEGG